jgi:transglutaminase-like putative cysteine protease
MSEAFAECLAATPMIDSGHPAVAAYARERAAGAADPVQAAVRLFYAVRDDLRYDPYRVRVDVDSLRASHALAARRGWCVSKAALLVACCRSLGIPARMGFADVRNHLSTARMREAMKTDVFYWHGYASIWTGERWVKATPAFNRELCEKFGLLPLEWDGRSDSLYHAFDREGRRHMEYLRERGEFADIPIERMRETFQSEYAQLAASWGEGDFDADVDAETRGADGPSRAARGGAEGDGEPRGAALPRDR